MILNNYCSFFVDDKKYIYIHYIFHTYADILLFHIDSTWFRVRPHEMGFIGGVFFSREDPRRSYVCVDIFK